MPPITAFSPAGTRISVIVPSSNASISIVALSVSISASTSPISTLSPTCLCHLITVPSVMVSESLGISILMAMGDSLEVAGRMGEMIWISSLFTSAAHSCKSAAWDQPGRACKSCWKLGAQGAIGFIVGTSPMCGLPTGPCALASWRVDSEVVPQQSFFGQ